MGRFGALYKFLVNSVLFVLRLVLAEGTVLGSYRFRVPRLGCHGDLAWGSSARLFRHVPGLLVFIHVVSQV